VRGEPLQVPGNGAGGVVPYAFEGLDNAGTAQLVLRSEPCFRREYRPDLLGGITVIHGVTADENAFLAIPFYALANREKSTQEVWVVQRGLKASPLTSGR
jgi:hypothetical protein